MAILTKRRVGLVVSVVVGLAALAQAIQPPPPPLGKADKAGAWQTKAVPAQVRTLLARACADCHSNDTNWPWYARLSPGSWLMSDHVSRGRRRLNFSIEYTLDEEEIGEIVEAAGNGSMPPPSYLWMHPEARLSESDKALLNRWWMGDLTE
ncbi:MAG: heme-binding domain-containing protein [Acidobacteria bacterium]|nr:heme-binding domain-containing protein [Acidobacteriota bacterium]